jgi:phage shock protein PspC (stress-responsive transcriptional regulator)
LSVNDRIYRTREDRMFLGVLGGFSLRFGIDPSIVRIAYAIVTVLTGIVPLVILYFVMAIVIPEAPPGYEAAARAAASAGAPPPSWTPAPPPPPSAWPPAGTPAPPGGSPAPPAADDASAGGVGFAAIPPGTAAIAAPPGAAAPTAPGGAAPGTGPAAAWGTGWDASGRPVTGETDHHARDARTGAIVGGLVLVGLGGAFLVAQLAPQLDWGIVGPVLLVALGIGLVVASFRRA